METEIRLPPPLDVAASLEMFRRAGDDGMDRWDGTTAVRTVQLDGRVAAYTLTTYGSLSGPRVVVATDHAGDLEAVTQLALRTFVADEEALARLRAIDPVVAALDERYPGVRPVRQLDLVGGLVRSISAQQVNLEFATVTRRRLAEAFGRRYAVDGFQAWRLDAAVLAGLCVADLRSRCSRDYPTMRSSAGSPLCAASGYGRRNGCWPGPWAGPGWSPVTWAYGRRSDCSIGTAPCPAKPTFARRPRTGVMARVSRRP